MFTLFIACAYLLLSSAPSMSAFTLILLQIILYKQICLFNALELGKNFLLVRRQWHKSWSRAWFETDNEYATHCCAWLVDTSRSLHHLIDDLHLRCCALWSWRNSICRSCNSQKLIYWSPSAGKWRFAWHHYAKWRACWASIAPRHTRWSSIGRQVATPQGRPAHSRDTQGARDQWRAYQCTWAFRSHRCSLIFFGFLILNSIDS